MECIIINTAGCSEILWLESIIYCSAEGSYTRIHLNDKRSVLSSKNLVWFERNLHSNHFVRLHRSFIINLKFVSKIYKHESKVSLRNGNKIPISKSRSK
ncbi:MAG: LytR/AlgR family response regulator transcription factor [Bacteroidota bacterium]